MYRKISDILQSRQADMTYTTSHVLIIELHTYIQTDRQTDRQEE